MNKNVKYQNNNKIPVILILQLICYHTSLINLDSNLNFNKKNFNKVKVFLKKITNNNYLTKLKNRISTIKIKIENFFIKKIKFLSIILLIMLIIMNFITEINQEKESTTKYQQRLINRWPILLTTQLLVSNQLAIKGDYIQAEKFWKKAENTYQTYKRLKLDLIFKRFYQKVETNVKIKQIKYTELEKINQKLEKMPYNIELLALKFKLEQELGINDFETENLIKWLDPNIKLKK